MQLPNKVSVLGVGISTTSYSDAVRVCGELIADAPCESASSTHEGRYVCVTSAHGLVLARSDDRFRAILNGAVLVTPDGMPVVWALRSFGVSGQNRVYGPDLMLELLKQAEAVGHRVFLYGGRPDTLHALASRLEGRYPELKIVGSYSPPFRPMTADEDAALIAMIRRLQPHLIFVGLSTPKQEYWMASHARAFPGAVLIGVGAAFDFHAGRVSQAPRWMQQLGLEWAFRLASEPRRLWRRYILITPRFLPLWGLQKLGLLSPRLNSSHIDL
jgi:N-acetylglucosaminyldiphosphoundecaprenol N-acetyl-beta-D-mannosaminyltransferase